MNFEVLIFELFQPDWEDMARSWTGCMTDQVTNLDLVGDQFCPYLGYKGCVGRTCDLLVLHCGSLLWCRLISKWPNVTYKQTIPSGKFHHPILSTQLWLFPADQRQKGYGILPNVSACYLNITLANYKVKTWYGIK